MLKSKKLLLFVVSIILMSLVSSVTVQKTEFIITTDPDENLKISVLNPDTKVVLQTFEGIAKKSGQYIFTYYGLINKIKLEAIVIDPQTKGVLETEELGPYTLGTPQIKLNFSIGKKEEKGEKLEEVQVVTQETTNTEENNPITGFATSESGSIPRIYYYITLAFIVIAITLLVFRKHIHIAKKSSPSQPNPKDFVKPKSDKPVKVEEVVSNVDTKTEPSIDETEKRIADLERQLDQIRKEEKLTRLQSQINQERNSLKKLQNKLSSPKARNELSDKKLFNN